MLRATVSCDDGGDFFPDEIERISRAMSATLDSIAGDLRREDGKEPLQSKLFCPSLSSLTYTTTVPTSFDPGLEKMMPRRGQTWATPAGISTLVRDAGTVQTLVAKNVISLVEAVCIWGRVWPDPNAVRVVVYRRGGKRRWAYVATFCSHYFLAKRKSKP
jgi:hypothetical protein